jgi:methoxymalonate biosynthesis acyl carrier protein
MSNNVTSQILAFISGRYPQVEITSTDNIFQIGFVNSLFAMELVMFIEKTFALTIPNEELVIDNFRTAKSMTELVARLSPDAALAEV